MFRASSSRSSASEYACVGEAKRDLAIWNPLQSKRKRNRTRNIAMSSMEIIKKIVKAAMQRYTIVLPISSIDGIRGNLAPDFVILYKLEMFELRMS